MLTNSETHLYVKVYALTKVTEDKPDRARTLEIHPASGFRSVPDQERMPSNIPDDEHQKQGFFYHLLNASGNAFVVFEDQDFQDMYICSSTGQTLHRVCGTQK